MVLGVDIETFSSVDLKECGLYRYVESPDFEVLLIAYALDDGPVTVLDLTRGDDQTEFLRMLEDPSIIKAAYNAAFEIQCLGKHVGHKLDLKQWRCTQVLAATLGLPRSLGEVAKALGFSQDKQKMSEGKRLISYFCVPCKPTKANGGRTRNFPHHAVDKWKTFCAYNAQDVVVEREIRDMLAGYEPDDDEQAAWVLDQQINQRGVKVDRRLVDQAIKISQEHSAALYAEAKLLTGLENPNSVAQLKGYLGVDSLTKADVADMRAAGSEHDRLLAIRQEAGKSSVKKYEAMQRSVCSDGRVHGLFQFYGGSRTGRWAGRLVQLQNLPQNHLNDLDLARNLVREGDREGLQMLFGSVPNTLSELIRTALVAKDGYTFAVADFAAIEARVIAWLAGEEWRREVFEKGGDIYCASASQMFGVPVEKHGVNGHLRQKGKIAELALGYGGGTGALVNMGALKMGLDEDELPGLVEMWRNSNPKIVQLWQDVGDAVMRAVKDNVEVELPKGMRTWRTNKLLHIKLPSGRVIRYYDPGLTENRFGHPSVDYQGYQTNGPWGRVESYGPKFVENIVQAASRDALRDSMLRVAEKYPDIVMHIHDEMVVEVPKDGAEDALKEIQALMGQPVPWAPGLLLRGDGYLTDYYRKD